MKTANRVCGKCGAEISDSATGQVCAACLLEMGLGLLTEEVQTSNAQRPAYSAEALAAKAGTSNAQRSTPKAFASYASSAHFLLPFRLRFLVAGVGCPWRYPEIVLAGCPR